MMSKYDWGEEVASQTQKLVFFEQVLGKCGLFARLWSVTGEAWGV